jgi:PAS domain S-box-containing protein
MELSWSPGVDALGSSDAFLRLVIQQVPAVFWTTDLNLRFTASLGGGLRSLGLQPQQVVGVSLFDFFRTTDLQFPPLAMHLRALRGESVRYEQEWAGNYYDVQIAPFRNAQDEIVGCIGVACDITRAKQFETQLREFREQLTDLTRSVPGVLFQAVVDAGSGSSGPGGVAFGYLSDQVVEYFGVTPDEARAHPETLLRAVPLDRNGALAANWRSIVCQMRPVTIELHTRPRPGTEYWLEIRAQPHRLGDERWQLNGLAIDVTQRKHVEAQLKEARDRLHRRFDKRLHELEATCERLQQEAQHSSVEAAELRLSEFRYRSLVDRCPLGIVELTPEGNILAANPAAHRLLGREAGGDLVGADLLSLVAEADRLTLRECLQAVGSKRPAQCQFQGIGLQALRICEIHLEPSGEGSGALRHITAYVLDVTERARGEQRLRTEQQLLRRLLDLQERERQLVACDLHDGLVQDLVGAKMFLESALRRHEETGTLPVEQLHLVVRHMDAAINEGRRMICDLRPLIIEERGPVDAIRYWIAEISAGSPLQIDFDCQVRFTRLHPLLEGALFRIAQEALNNVRRHSRATHASVRLYQIGDRVYLSISDNGVGFRPEEVPPDRFGLRGIRERARLFHGGASIISQPGEGTRVLVDLPTTLEEE